jgi:arylsulfatase
MVNGIAQKPIEGVSMAYTFDKANANVPSARTTQYFEMFGNRAIYHDGWIAATTPPAAPWLLGLTKMPDVVNGYNWELYNIADDYSEANDLAARMPDKLRELQELFLVEATKYGVFPLDNSIAQRLVAPRPSATAGRNVFAYSGEMSGLPESAAPNILNRSYTITAEIEVPQQGGGDGMIVTEGGRFGGYGLYLLKGKSVFLYNMLGLERFRWEGQQALAPGKHTIVFDFTYDGPGLAKGGTGVLKVDDREVASRKIPHTIPFLLTIDETLDVGIDTRTPVDDKDYQVPFRFTGKVDKVTFKLGPTQLTSEDHQKIQHTLARAKD